MGVGLKMIRTELAREGGRRRRRERERGEILLLPDYQSKHRVLNESTLNNNNLNKQDKHGVFVINFTDKTDTINHIFPDASNE